MSSNFLKGIRLTPDQRKAVTYDGSSLLVLSGAGSGKTRVLTVRFSWLVREMKVKPTNIFMVTFTNRAANEMKERVGELLGINPEPLWIGTFHNLCLHLLSNHPNLTGLGEDFTILGEEDQVRVLASVLRKQGIKPVKSLVYEMMDQINSWQDAGLTSDDVQALNKHTVDTRLPGIYAAYEERLYAMQALDFGSIMLRTIQLLEAEPDVLARYQKRFKYLLVDEYQDTNTVQVNLLKLLKGDEGSLTAVGDDDQAIYGWRGAEVDHILTFEDVFPGAQSLNLRDNHRSTRSIFYTARTLVQAVEGRRVKNLRAARHVDTGTPVEIHNLHDAEAEADFVVAKIKAAQEAGQTLADIAVLYRAEWVVGTLEEKLVEAGIPFRISSRNRFFERDEVRDAVAWLRLVQNRGDNAACMRLLRQPQWGFDATLLQEVDALITTRRSALAAVKKLSKDAELPPKTRENLTRFCDVHAQVTRHYKSKATPAKLVHKAMESSGYRAWLLAQDTNEARNQLKMLDRLTGEVMADYVATRTFLQEVSLVDRSVEDENIDALQLLTGHAAKGLEFKTVFLIGWERSVFPNNRADPVEEMRLAYVMITRGREKVYITHASRRSNIKWVRPSAYINLLTESDLQKKGHLSVHT